MSKHGESPLAGARPEFISYSSANVHGPYRASPDSTRGRTRGPVFPVNESSVRDKRTCSDCHVVIPVACAQCPACRPADTVTRVIRSRRSARRMRASKAV